MKITMTEKEACDVLESFNAWRKLQGEFNHSPRELDLAINKAIEMLKKSSNTFKEKDFSILVYVITELHSDIENNKSRTRIIQYRKYSDNLKIKYLQTNTFEKKMSQSEISEYIKKLWGKIKDARLKNWNNKIEFERMN